MLALGIGIKTLRLHLFISTEVIVHLKGQSTHIVRVERWQSIVKIAFKIHLSRRNLLHSFLGFKYAL